MPNDTVASARSLPPSVSPTGSGCREPTDNDSNWLRKTLTKEIAVAIRKPAPLAENKNLFDQRFLRAIHKDGRV
ncbi:hypothetical protein [Desulfovibrio sp.]|uniref:hypothetical protein n=1 Tax=Desulfovibrio sp. TaxID=885 RepID=UPI0025C14895|nr:hypothetical protein [Desulfovibrio sp.]